MSKVDTIVRQKIFIDTLPFCVRDFATYTPEPIIINYPETGRTTSMTSLYWKSDAPLAVIHL